MTFSVPRAIGRSALLLSTILFGLGGMPAAHAESLNDAVLSALQRHPSVEAAKASMSAAKEQKREQVSGYFPEININGQAGRMFADNSTSRGLVTTRGEAYSYLGEGSVTLRQKFFDGMETANRVDAAEARTKSAFNNLFEVREELALRAAQAYVNVLRAREGARMIAEHRAKVADYLGRIKNMLNEGAASEADYQQALDIQVILDGILADFEGQVMAAEAQYAEAVGTLPPADLDEPAVPPGALPEEIVSAVKYALENHPTIQAAKFESRAAAHEIDAEEATLYPDLNGELSYLKSDKRDEIGGEAEDARAVLRMNWNFSTGGGQFARIRRSKYTHKEAMARMHDLERQIERDIRLAFSEYLTAGKQLDLLGQRRALNEKLFETYTVQFEGARVNLLQLMQAHNQLFNTKLETMNGLYRLLAAKYAVLASIGRLQDSLGLSAVALSPDWKQDYAQDIRAVAAVPPVEMAEEPVPVEAEPLPAPVPVSVPAPEVQPESQPQPEPEKRGAFLTIPEGVSDTQPQAGEVQPEKRLLTGGTGAFKTIRMGDVLDKSPPQDTQSAYKAVRLTGHD